MSVAILFTCTTERTNTLEKEAKPQQMLKMLFTSWVQPVDVVE